jgi:hypothetical protein
MFNFKKTEPDPLQMKIDEIFSEMAGFTGDTEEYNKLTDQLVKLKKLQKEMNPSWRPSSDAMIGAVSSVLGIVLILHYEKAGVITSKALGFVNKMRQ